MSVTEQMVLDDNSTIALDTYTFQLTPLRLDPHYIRLSHNCYLSEMSFQIKS